PMYLGGRVVLARSFARIHRANLINWGIVPLTLDDPASYEAIEAGGRLRLDGLRAALAAGERVPVLDTRTGRRFSASCVLTARERDILLAGGPFAVDERLVPGVAGETRVRIHNTNTRKLIVAHVPVKDGEAAVEGDFELAGVPGRGARIALDFLDPGGAGTGRLLPTGRPRDLVDGVEASLVDATNPVVFVRAKDLGL